MQIVVVGAGIAGLSTAWALTKAGHSVTLLEQGPIPNPLGASGDHHRIIRRAYAPASGYGRLIDEAYLAWDALWDDLGRSHLDPRGFLCVSRVPGDEAEIYLEGLRDGGYPFDLIEPAEAARRWLFLAPESLRYGYVSPEGGALHCRRIAADLSAWLTRHGANVYASSRVAAVDPETGEVTLDTGDRLRGDRVVVAAGAWVLKLFPQLAASLTTFRTAVVYLEPPPDLANAWAQAPVILDVGGDTDGYIIPPSGDGGLKFGSGLHKVQTSDPDWNREAVAGEGEAIRDLFHPPLARLGEYAIRDVVTCAYTFTRNERFFATRLGRCLVVSACSGHGYKFGAAVGRRIAAAIGDDDLDGLLAWLEARAA